jgi:hypothetical protein
MQISFLKYPDEENSALSGLNKRLSDDSSLSLWQTKMSCQQQENEKKEPEREEREERASSSPGSL